MMEKFSQRNCLKEFAPKWVSALKIELGALAKRLQGSDDL